MAVEGSCRSLKSSTPLGLAGKTRSSRETGRYGLLIPSADIDAKGSRMFASRGCMLGRYSISFSDFTGLTVPFAITVMTGLASLDLGRFNTTV